MKTLKQTMLILLLLLFVGSYEVLAQTESNQSRVSENDSIIKTMVDENAIRLRIEMLDYSINNKFREALQIGDTLWQNQKTEGDFITLGEYWALLFLNYDFENFMLDYRQKQARTDYEPRSNFINQEIMKKLYEFQTDILQEIIKDTNIYQQARLMDTQLSLMIPKIYIYREKKKAEKKPEFISIGIESGSNIGFYKGDISNYVNRYANYLYLGIFVEVWRFYATIGFSIGSTYPINKINFYDEDIPGNFSGKNYCPIIRLGFNAYSGQLLKISSNVGFFSYDHKVLANVQGEEAGITGFSCQGISTGISANINILSKKSGNIKRPWLLLTAKYDLLIGNKVGMNIGVNNFDAIKDQYYKCFGHQFGLGIIFQKNFE
jgi:hypothetical protein